MLTYELNFLKLLENIRSDFLNGFFEAITMLGEETIIIVLMAAVYFMADKNLARRIFFIATASLSVNCITKNFVKRPRPFTRGISCVREETATGYSFPSGHTQTFATWSSAFSFYFKKNWMLILSVVLSLLVGLSRLYLGAHYPSDVIVGMILGFGFAYFGNKLYDKVQNKNILHLGLFLILTPFAVWFMICPDPLFEDFFKLYGMVGGFFLSVLFEEKFAKLDNNVSLSKKIIRVISCILIALIVKEGLKMLFTFSDLRISLLFDGVRYFMLVFILLGICPLILKKTKM